MDANTMAVIALVMQVLVLAVGGVWTVGKIRTSTAVLNANIEHLTKEIHDLTNVVKLLDRRIDDHERRLTILETNHGRRHPEDVAAGS